MIENACALQVFKHGEHSFIIHSVIRHSIRGNVRPGRYREVVLIQGRVKLWNLAERRLSILSCRKQLLLCAPLGAFNMCKSSGIA